MTSDHPIPLSMIIYYVNSTDDWFKQVSYPVLPNAYHLILFAYDPNTNNMSVMGTKSGNRIYNMHESTLTSKVGDIFSYVIYNN